MNRFFAFVLLALSLALAACAGQPDPTPSPVLDLKQIHLWQGQVEAATLGYDNDNLVWRELPQEVRQDDPQYYSNGAEDLDYWEETEIIGDKTIIRSFAHIELEVEDYLTYYTFTLSPELWQTHIDIVLAQVPFLLSYTELDRVSPDLTKLTNPVSYKVVQFRSREWVRYYIKEGHLD